MAIPNEQFVTNSVYRKKAIANLHQHLTTLRQYVNLLQSGHELFALINLMCFYDKTSTGPK
jgi:DMSO reductase anchor subunit